MGSGTALVEAIVAGRRAYGTDINPVAALIAKAKTTAIEPSKLHNEVDSVFAQLLRSSKAPFDGEDYYRALSKRIPFLGSDNNSPIEDRIDYWFPTAQKKELAIILANIMTVKDREVQTFLLCSFSNILKNCSRWMMKSVKPTRDHTKEIASPIRTFFLQTHKMVKRNKEFWDILQGRSGECTIDNIDARNLSLKDDSVALVVTSPPYVTSYEYADLHQLTALWLQYTNSLNEFRSKFIGSIHKGYKDVNLYSTIAKQTIDRLESRDKREALGVKRYFFEMQQCFEEMQRILKSKGKVAIVIGDTALKKVEIKNSDVFIQTMERIGFKKYRIIKRPVPGRILPLTRDEKTGRFARTANADRLAYPTEFILIMEKL
jgi:DNA modification methylase